MIETNFDTFAKDFLKMMLSPLGEVRTNFEVSEDKPQYVSMMFRPSSVPESYTELEGYSHKKELKPEDAFSQDVLENVLSPFGRVQTNVEIPMEPILIDLWFSPAKDLEVPKNVLGMLGRIAKTECVIVPYDWQLTSEDILDSMLQMLRLQSNFLRLTNQEERKISDIERHRIYPRLWVIAPSFDDDILDDYAPDKAKTWSDGVYSLAPAFLTKIIDVSKLPQNPKTIWLRILGDGEVRKQPIAEVLALPHKNPHRDSVLELLTKWKIS